MEPRVSGRTASTDATDNALTDDRGGTEPLAALVSVAAICVAISIYAGFASVTLSHTTGNSGVDRATLDTVWADVSNDGLFDSVTALESAVEPETLPRGYHARVAITRVGGDGHFVTVGEAVFDDRGRVVETPIDPPPDSQSKERPIPIRIRAGDVRPGRLAVEVWDA